MSLGPMLPTQYGEETTHIVIDGRMNEFINSVENDEGKQIKVMSVHGSSGLGKTHSLELCTTKLVRASSVKLSFGCPNNLTRREFSMTYSLNSSGSTPHQIVRRLTSLKISRPIYKTKGT